MSTIPGANPAHKPGAYVVQGEATPFQCVQVLQARYIGGRNLHDHLRKSVPLVKQTVPQLIQQQPLLQLAVSTYAHGEGPTK